MFKTINLLRIIILSIIITIVAIIVLPADSEVFSLNMDQRRLFLHYYSPLILKCADEDKYGGGYDWIANFDFDQDGIYYNNKKSWETGLSDFVKGSGNTHWVIRPTLYTFLIEFMEKDRKNLILFYHIYHAKDRKNIHDWERIEIRLDNVKGDPGSGESIRYVVITQHTLQDSRSGTHKDLNFYETGKGKHILIHQSRWNGYLELYKNELRYVTQPLSEFYKSGSDPAKVNVNGFEGTNFHYIYVDRADSAAVTNFDAQKISPGNADSLTSGEDVYSTVSLDKVIRIQYELQDVADIVSSQWEENNQGQHWHLKPCKIKMADPMYSEDGKIIEVPGSNKILTFISGVKRNTTKKGYVGKAWFWGRYSYGSDAPTKTYGFADPRRIEANGFADCVSAEYYWQHDYFAHSGEDNPLNFYPKPRMSDFNEEKYWQAESGEWLKSDWYREENSGFDGRWVQIFPDE